MKLYYFKHSNIPSTVLSSVKKELYWILAIMWFLGLFYTLYNQYRTYISDYHTYAGLSASEKTRKVFGTELPDFAVFCDRVIPIRATINWETYNSFDQHRLAYYLLYPRILSPEPDYLIVYHSGTTSSTREYAFHPIDVSIKIPDRIIEVNPGEIIGQNWISSENIQTISQINLFMGYDSWSQDDRIELSIYQGVQLLRRIVKDNLQSQGSSRITFVFDPYLKIIPNTRYFFTIRILTRTENKVRIFVSNQLGTRTGTAIRFNQSQPYTLCYQVFHGYTNYSILTSYTNHAYIMVRNK